MSGFRERLYPLVNVIQTPNNKPMKIAPSKIILSCLALSAGAALTCAADTNVVLTTSDAQAAVTSLNGAGKWNDGNPPHAGANYFTTNFFIRTPTDSGNVTYTFGGDSLSLGPVPTGTARNLIYKGNGANDVFVINNLTNLLGGILENGGSGAITCTYTGNLWTISANSAVVADQGPVIIGYPIAGPDGVVFTNAGGNGTGITFNGTMNAFTGKMYISTVNLGNGGGSTHVILNAANCFPGNPSTPTPDQIKMDPGCSLQDNVGLLMNNANGGILLMGGTATINSGSVTVIGEPITDLTNGLVSSLATLTTAGGGTIVLSNANNNYSGNTVISAGVLQVGVNNAIPGNSTNGNVTVTGTLDLDGHSATINGLSGAGIVDNTAAGGGTLAFGANGASATFTGTLQNTGAGGTLSVVKTGAGTETFSGAFTYSGATTVAAGTLNMTTAVGVPGTGGNLVISNGAVLNANVSSGNAFPINNLIEATNSSLNLTLIPGANAINATGTLTFQDNATNNLNYGTVTGNPTALFINAAGGISAPGTNIVLNLNATGLQVGSFTLIKYSGASLGSIANFQLNPPPGVAATLFNNMGNDSIDVHITAIPNNLSWYGLNGNNWDLSSVNWSNTATTALTVFQEYTNGSVIAGDAVTFDDTLTNSSPQPTNITLNSTFFAFPVVVNSTLPYSISGTGGITGVTSVLKTNTGTLNMNVSNSYTGGTIIAGGTEIITNDSALGTNSGLLTFNNGSLEIATSFTNNVRPISIQAPANIGVSGNNFVQLGGSITGNGGLNKQDTGSLLLSGKSSLMSGSTGNLWVKFGTVTIPTGGSMSNAYFDDVGQDTNDSATLNLGGGILTTLSDFNLGDLGASTGTVNLTNGTMTVNALFVGSANAAGSTASGTFNQYGGTNTEVNTGVGEFCIGGRTSTSGVGVYNLFGGVLNAGAGIRVGSTGIGTFNINGGTVNALQGINIARIAGSIGTNNLNGGLLATFNVSSSTVTNCFFNFNGGTLQAQFNPQVPWFLNMQQANILAGGAIIDSSTNTAIVAQSLLAGSPNGGLTKLGSGTLILSNVNTFTGPITNNAGTLALNAGSTYQGQLVANTGTITVAAGNTFQGGATVANGGTVQITTGSSIPGPVTIKTNGVLSISQIGSATMTLGSLTFNGSATGTGGTIALTPSASDNTNVAMVNCGALTLTGTNSVSVAANVGQLALIKYSPPIVGTGNLTNLILSQGAIGVISNDVTDSILFAVITSSGPGLVWTGTNTAALNTWNINATTNWLVNGTATSYHQIIIPGDAVTFNDVGSGTVILNTNVGPGSIVISNSAKAYTFSGSGSISGGTGITKLGTGTATINLTNDNNLGNTVISNGTLQVGTISAISPTGNLIIGPSGTLQLAANNQTAGDLIGSGVVDNNSGTRAILTVGGATGGTWNGTITNTGAAGMTLHKLGNGTWVVGGSNYLNDLQPFQTQDTFSAGTVIITNGGLITISQLELRIADGNVINGSTGTLIIAGGILSVTNNPLTIGINSNNANGTFIMNNGTVIVGTGNPAGFFSGSPNNLVVGGAGASGTMTMNGGLVIDGQDVWLGQNAGASGTLNLNGGVLQANTIANSGGPAISVANFNGGTLRAGTNNPSFLQVSSMIMSNGLVLDDNGFTLNIVASPLQAGDGFNGGLIKMGSGTVYLDAFNNYTGTTTVTNGTLGGVGTIGGPVVVGPSGNLFPGDDGAVVSSPLTISSNVTLHGTTTFRISNNGNFAASDQIIGVATANYGGTLVVSNVTTDLSALTNGETFQLFNAVSASGNFANIVGSPGAGLSYVFNPATGVLSVTNAVVKSIPHFTSIKVSGTTLTINAVNGTPGGQFVLIGSTNILKPLINWTPILTNTFDGSGNLNLTTNIVNPAVPVEFYLLSQ